MAKNWHTDTPKGWKENKAYHEYHEFRPKGYWKKFDKMRKSKESLPIYLQAAPTQLERGRAKHGALKSKIN